jgi:hypothetical protein
MPGAVSSGLGLRAGGPNSLQIRRREPLASRYISPSREPGPPGQAPLPSPDGWSLACAGTAGRSAHSHATPGSLRDLKSRIFGSGGNPVTVRATTPRDGEPGNTPRPQGLGGVTSRPLRGEGGKVPTPRGTLRRMGEGCATSGKGKVISIIERRDSEGAEGGAIHTSHPVRTLLSPGTHARCGRSWRSGASVGCARKSFCLLSEVLAQRPGPSVPISDVASRF